MAWMPDDEEVVFWCGGKIHQIHINALDIRNIPLSVDVSIEFARREHFLNKIPSESFKPQVIKDAATSPDGDLYIPVCEVSGEKIAARWETRATYEGYRFRV